MKRGIIITLSILIIAGLIAIPAMAQHESRRHMRHGVFNQEGMGPGSHHMPIWKNQMAIAKLGLTEDQITSLKEHDFDFKEKAISKKADLEKAQLELQKQMSRYPINENKARQAAQKVAQAQSDMFLLHVDHQLGIKKLLTQEQINEMESMTPHQHHKRVHHKRVGHRMVDDAGGDAN